MPRINERTHSATKINRMNELFEVIKDSRDPALQEVADEIHIRKCFGVGMDGQPEEQQQYDPSDSEKNVSNAQSFYDREKQRLRNLGTNGNSFDKDRNAVMRQANNDDSLTKVNAERSKDFSSFSKHPGQPSLRSDVVFDSFKHGARQGRY